ncbi:MAG TPA: exosortase system-associated protein, TIGR04073 family [Candidatus Omnitrophota bacterium]|nr:exosortase system-associated protein, TIGR04073 family [Candidatus Omnitrophota bacterium]HPT07275.1 exosortase system-associated protein, TIGR04073 family [Candidatus Omnitrophota bacterium]
MKNTLILVAMVAVVFGFAACGYAQMTQEIAAQPSIAAATAAYHETIYLKINKPRTLIEQQNAEEAKAQPYFNTPADKMGGGIINLTTFWLDVPRTISQDSQEHSLFYGMTIGFFRGLAESVMRGSSGAIDAVTFGLPPYDKPTMHPVYTVRNPQEGLRINILSW